MTIHRYNGTVTDPLGFYSWQCTCNATGAVRYETVDKAKRDFEWHALAGDYACDLCTATTSEPFDRADGITGTVCEDCYPSTLTNAERMEAQ